MNSNINIKTLKRSLVPSDYKAVEDALGLRRFSDSPIQTVFYNADAHKDQAKQKPKLYGYKDTHVYMSYTRGASMDIFGLVQAVKTTQGETCSFLDAVNFVLSSTGKSQDTYQRKSKGYAYDWEDSLGKFLRIKRGESSLPTFSREILDQLPTFPCQQWIDEGISADTQEKFHIGWYPRLDATTIPVFDNEGELVGLRCRHWREDEIEMGKYRPLQLLDGTIYKFNTNDILFGMNYNRFAIEETKTVWLVESEKAVMKLDTFYGEKSCALGMFGKNLGLKRRNQILKLGVNKVIYIPDNDWIGNGDEEFKAWQDEVIKFAEQFKGYAEVEVVWDSLGLLGEKENATDGDRETWEKLFEEREVAR